MDIQQIAIFDSIAGYIEQLPVVTLRKGEYLIRHDEMGTGDVYYILDGRLRVLNNMGGRCVYVDEVSWDCFTGELSNVHKQNLRCDIKAEKDTTLLKLPKEMFDELMDDARFARIFYHKTSQRVYNMYRRMLVLSLYNQKEILTAYILKNTRGSVFYCPNVVRLCENLGFSRRNYYNTMNQLVREGLLEKVTDYYIIKDRKTMAEQAGHVLECLNF